jgi:hypothetical protein
MLRSKRVPALPITVVNAEPTPRIGPLDVVELIADDSAGAALDAALVGEQDSAVVAR